MIPLLMRARLHIQSIPSTVLEVVVISAMAKRVGHLAERPAISFGNAMLPCAEVNKCTTQVQKNAECQHRKYSYLVVQGLGRSTTQLCYTCLLRNICEAMPCASATVEALSRLIASIMLQHNEQPRKISISTPHGE